jgi:hypothetical protein
MVLLMASATLATHAQQSTRPVRMTRLATLLDEDKVAFGINVNFGGVGDGALDATRE